MVLSTCKEEPSKEILLGLLVVFLIHRVTPAPDLIHIPCRDDA